MNRVCAVHNEYCPDGDCRWCVAPAAETEVLGLDFRYGFAMHQPAAEPELYPVTMTEAMHAPLAYYAAALVVTGIGSPEAEPDAGFSINADTFKHWRAGVSYPDLGWPPGGVTGSGL